MLTPKQLSELPDNVVKLYEELEDDIIRDMARRIVKTDFATETTQWQLSRLQEMGITHDAVFDKLSKATSKSDEELIAMFNEAAETAYNADKKAYVKAGYNPAPLAENQQLQKIINAGLVKTQALFQNLTNTTANTATQQFENALDTAYMQIVSGAFDYNTAIRTCIKTLAEKGIATIKYPTGHTDYLDVAVRRAALTGVGQTTGEMQLALAEEMGSDLVEVTVHNGARPSHMEWQGKVYSLSGTHPKHPDFVKSTGYGTGDGLKGWNCRHDFFPFFEDSEPAYTQEELNEYENRKVTYNGVEMSEYDATQKQRAFERRIRATKRELTALDAGIKETDDANLKESLQAEFDRKSVLLKKQEAKIKDFTQQTGLYRDRAREQSYGFNKSVSQKAVWEYKKYIKAHFESGQYLEITKRIGTNDVDLSYVHSNEFRSKFNKITNNSKINDTLRNYAEAMLTHRKGTDGEDLYIIHSETGELLLRDTKDKNELGVEIDFNTIKHLRNNYSGKMIGIHNHPTNLPPTGSDFVASGDRGYDFGLVITHNGKVYKYKSGEHPFLPQLFDMRIDKYTKNAYNKTIEEIHIDVLNEFAKEYGIEWQEL